MPSADRLDDEAGDLVSTEPAGELFYRGTLIRLSRGGSFGTVRSASNGREIAFERQHAVVLGESELREGMLVGYDVGWTSRGLRVTKLFPAPPVAAPVTEAGPCET